MSIEIMRIICYQCQDSRKKSRVYLHNRLMSWNEDGLYEKVYPGDLNGGYYFKCTRGHRFEYDYKNHEFKPLYKVKVPQ